MPKSSYREDNFQDTLKQILPGFLKIAGIIAVLGLVFWGISSVLSNNDPDFVYQAPDSPFAAVRDFNPSVGSTDARVVMMVVEDSECPNCAIYHDITKSVKVDYADNVRFVTKFLPLEQIHPMARDGARALYAAKEQDRYTEYVDLLFDEQDSLDLNQLDDWAEQLGLDVDTFKTDRNSTRIDNYVTTDIRDLEEVRLPTDVESAPTGATGRITGTPTTVIFVQDGDKYRVFDWWGGAQDVATIIERLDAAIAETNGEQSEQPELDEATQTPDTEDGEFVIPVPDTNAE